MRFFLLLLTLSVGLQAQPWEKPSASEGLVVWRSAAKVLSAGDEEALEAVLGAINDSTSTQIVVLFVDRVNDDLNFVAAQTGEAWGIGQAETDNGMLVLIALEDRKMAIQVGRGLEPTITDLVSHQLIENTLKPAFRNQDYLGGVQALAQEVAQRLSGQFDAAPGKERKLPVLPILIALAAIFALSSRGGGRGPGGMMFGPMGGMPLGGGGFGGRGGGGFGGGGFGGFGGGSFGGGGASGSW